MCARTPQCPSKGNSPFGEFLTYMFLSPARPLPALYLTGWSNAALLRLLTIQALVQLLFQSWLKQKPKLESR